jgi:phage shock protein C
MNDSPKKLYRSRTERRISGVCGGLAEYFNIDPTLVRLLFVLGLLLVGGTLWAYIILMIVIPEEPL